MCIDYFVLLYVWKYTQLHMHLYARVPLQSQPLLPYHHLDLVKVWVYTHMARSSAPKTCRLAGSMLYRPPRVVGNVKWQVRVFPLSVLFPWQPKGIRFISQSHPINDTTTLKLYAIFWTYSYIHSRCRRSAVGYSTFIKLFMQEFSKWIAFALSA